jgi:hypothetical protein
MQRARAGRSVCDLTLSLFLFLCLEHRQSHVTRTRGPISLSLSLSRERERLGWSPGSDLRERERAGSMCLSRRRVLAHLPPQKERNLRRRVFRRDHVLSLSLSLSVSVEKRKRLGCRAIAPCVGLVPVFLSESRNTRARTGMCVSFSRKRERRDRERERERERLGWPPGICDLREESALDGSVSLREEKPVRDHVRKHKTLEHAPKHGVKSIARARATLGGNQDKTSCRHQKLFR